MCFFAVVLYLLVYIYGLNRENFFFFFWDYVAQSSARGDGGGASAAATAAAAVMCFCVVEWVMNSYVLGVNVVVVDVGVLLFL